MTLNNKNTKPLSFNLSEISKWQLDFDNSKVELPPLQRSFVWKASQIESLWDSILRGFPIGSFLMSKSEDEKLFLLDGQQRATSITLGFYDPWHNKQENENNSFWSLKNVPIVWIDLSPKEKTITQKFVIRVVTQSHPWGYQRVNHNSILSVSDRKKALEVFQANSENKINSYIKLPPLSVFPFDADMPVPLPFVIKAISEFGESWRDALILMCEENLPNITTKQSIGDSRNFTTRLTEIINHTEFDDGIFDAIENLQHIEIPSIIVQKEILKADDEQTGEDPTLFVRLNSSGTRIVGEELIYSIYKASFPEAKKLVESIGASFVAPSLVISLVARLAFSEINGRNYPNPISVNDFRKKIKDEKFKEKMKELVGNETHSPANSFFSSAIDILRSEKDFAIPPVLVKSIIKSSPDLFLMLLQWVKLNDKQYDLEVRKKILTTITALSWFGRDNGKFVREIWHSISLKDFWSKQVLQTPLFNKKDFLMYPLIQPITLRNYLIEEVVKKNIKWDALYPDAEHDIVKTYKKVLNFDGEQETEVPNLVEEIWDYFMKKLFGCKPLVLFAQREYINENFGDFNQMETLDDTNTPWDWDHIYPASWVYAKWYIDQNTKHWTYSIGNLRAMSLEENRSENNSLSPKDRLADVKTQSFIKENDWKYWKEIGWRINADHSEMVKNHLSAIIHRFCNIYEEWYTTLEVDELFDFSKNLNIISEPVLELE